MESPAESRAAVAVQNLPPGYFALVMATGIISLGLHLESIDVLSMVLFVVAAAGYVVLLVLTLWRGIRYPTRIVDDFSAAHNGFSFFTFVAGTNVLGARIAAEGGNVILPFVLLSVSFAAWIILGYVIPGLVIGRHQGADILSGINGTWFIWSVASQSVAVLAASLEPKAPKGISDALSIVAVLSWGIGLILYGVIGCAVVIRLLTRGISAAELGPPYWVTMGAGAITVLAGSRIVEMTDTAMLSVVQAPVAAAAVVFWAFATWLIPALFGIGLWRHAIKKIPLQYEASLWSMVFPLGMYAVAGIYLGDADDLPIVGWIGGRFLWVALVVWAVIFVWMIASLVVASRAPRASSIARSDER
ncbi:tellurite resistance/C4-dicarboxylate transporter family protein [Paramicrobacterium chengjingii]|uniref:tellurite resistance/C4-dicarboxylate transporter family protein n=1 Tax=Paramicrobacterium chengjingii TaxID=2769067 RepID=UPI001F1C66A5|nr:tellurite resistance/C4-dicarboxylate transporter family protein [Microbacterium chengjingii]